MKNDWYFMTYYSPCFTRQSIALYAGLVVERWGVKFAKHERFEYFVVYRPYLRCGQARNVSASFLCLAEDLGTHCL